MSRDPISIAAFWKQGKEQELREEILGYMLHVSDQNVLPVKEDDLIAQMRRIASKLAPILSNSDTSLAIVDEFDFFVFLDDLSGEVQNDVIELLIQMVFRIRFPNQPEDEALLDRVRAI